MQLHYPLLLLLVGTRRRTPVVGCLALRRRNTDRHWCTLRDENVDKHVSDRGNFPNGGAGIALRVQRMYVREDGVV